MAVNRYLQRGKALHQDPRFGRLLLVSLAGHILLFLLFQVAVAPRVQAPRKTVYYVDLSQMPVRDPQAGRPVPPAPAPKTPPAAPPAPPAPQPAAPPPSPAPAKPKAVPAPAAQPAKAPAPKPAATPAPKEQTVDDAIARLRRKQEVDELKTRLNQLAARDTRAADASTAPLGTPQGRGTQPGVDELTWIQAFLKENWSLSRYQVGSLDLEAAMELRYDAAGKLSDYRFLRKSGDTVFDDSLVRAVLKARQLPFAPERPLTVEAVFNLKDLLK